MGRKKREGPNLSAIFKQYFRDHPEWLRARSNDAVMAQFRADHPEIEIEPRIRQAMFNAKNYLKKGGKGKLRRKRKVAAVQAVMARPQRGAAALQMLEDQIDDCLAMAKQISRDELADVITSLRRARNRLIVKIES